jgi:hypothetical protein
MARAVIAFYYAWYDMGDWAKGQTSAGDLPKPQYDGSSDETLNRHIQQAANAGIDALACAWKGPGDTRTTNTCKRLLELAAASGRIKVVMFADEAGGWFSEANMVKAIEMLKSDFMSSPAYYTVGDKPALLAWRAEQLGDVATWQRVRDKVDPEHELFWMGGTATWGYLDFFDSVFFFDISWEKTPGVAMRSYFSNVTTYNSKHPGADKPFVGTAQAAYDDRGIIPARPPHEVKPHTPDAAYYIGTWQDVTKRRACAVVLTSFNEFFEGSYIEPSDQFDDLYLRETKRLISEYKGAP